MGSATPQKVWRVGGHVHARAAVGFFSWPGHDTLILPVSTNVSKRAFCTGQPRAVLFTHPNKCHEPATFAPACSQALRVTVAKGRWMGHAQSSTAGCCVAGWKKRGAVNWPNDVWSLGGGKRNRQMGFLQRESLGRCCAFRSMTILDLYVT